MPSRTSVLGMTICVVLLFSENGCIPVEEFGQCWEKGTVDPALRGAWKSSEQSLQAYGQFFSFEESGDRYDVRSIGLMDQSEGLGVPSLHAKTLLAGTHRYLMLDLQQYYEEHRRRAADMAREMPEFGKEAYERLLAQQETEYKGLIIRYKVDDGVLKFYLPDYNALAEAIRNGNIEGTVCSKEEMLPLKMARLDEKTLAFLGQICDDQRYWEQTQEFKQVDNLQEELDKLRSLFHESVKPMPIRHGGKVVLPDGRPVAQAQVRAYRIRPAMVLYNLPQEFEFRTELTTDEEGNFSFTLPSEEASGGYLDRLMLVAKKDSHAVGWTNVGMWADSESTLTLSAPVNVRGVVVDDGNVPIANAEVRGILTHREGGGFGTNTLYGLHPLEWMVVTANRKGQFELSGVPAGTMVQFLVTAEGYAQLYTPHLGLYEGRPGTTIAGSSGLVSLVLPRTATIEGFVKTKDSNCPVVAVELLAEAGEMYNRLSPAFVLKTDDDGGFQLVDLPSGTYWLRVPDVNLEQEMCTALPVCFHVASGETASGDLELVEGSWVEVTAVDANDGQPMPEVSVGMGPDAKFIRQYCSPKRVNAANKLILRKTWRQTGADGKAFFKFAPSQYGIYATAHGYEASSLKDIILENGTPVSLQIRLARIPEAGKIKGLVLDEHRQPVGGAAVYVSPSIGGGLVGSSNANGTFEFSLDKVYNRYDSNDFICLVVARLEQRGLVGLAEIKVEPDEIVVPMSRGAVLKGTLVSSTGKPLGGLRPSLILRTKDSYVKFSSRREFESCVTDKQGCFEIKGLPLGYEYSLSARAKGHARAYLFTKIGPDELIKDMGRIVLAVKNLSVAGTVYDKKGEPVAGATVRILMNEVLTDESGHFVYEGLARGTLKITASVRGTNLEGKTVAMSGDQNIEIRLKEVPVPATPYVLSEKPGEQPKWVKQDLPSHYSLLQISVQNAITFLPVVGAQVIVTLREGKAYYEATTNEKGCADLAVLEKTNYVVESVCALGYQPITPNKTIDGGAAGVIGMSFLINPKVCPARIVVLDKNGQPVQRARVRHLVEIANKWHEATTEQTVCTNEHGEAPLQWLIDPHAEPSKHLVLITDASNSEILVAGMESTDECNRTITLKMGPRVRPIGHVVDVNGSPLHGLWVNLNMVGANVMWLPMRTNAEGRYTARPVPVGFQYRVHAGGQGHTCANGQSYKGKSIRFEAHGSDGDYVEVGDLVLDQE